MCLSILRTTGFHWFASLWLALCLMSPASAHEFWLEPTAYQVGEDGMLIAHLRNGENFEGYASAYLSSRTTRFELITAGRTDPVIARLGDNPALNMKPVQAGLNIVVHQSDTSVLTYTNWEKFKRFADHKDFPDVRARHRARSLSETRFSEAYSRYSKSLIAVGDGNGRDQITGLDIELVAMQNPYTDDLTNGLQVKALYLDDVRRNVQIELFEKSQTGEVKVTLYRTDEQGIATLPVKPDHSYLVDMVVLRQPSATLAKEKSVVWETLWASLTFAVPR